VISSFFHIHALFALNEGTILSTIILSLVLVAATFPAISYTLLTGNLNAVDQLPDLPVYINVYVFHVEVHHTTALLCVTYVV
jgi:hypothetical protein